MQASPTDLSSEAYKKNPHDQTGLKTFDSCSTYTLLLPVSLGYWAADLRKKLWTFVSKVSELVFPLQATETPKIGILQLALQQKLFTIVKPRPATLNPSKIIMNTFYTELKSNT